MRHEAIYALYPTVVRIEGDGSSAIAYDKDDKKVSLDNDALVKKEEDLLKEAKLNMLRIERNNRLIDTDYYGLSDQTMSSNMKTYRQELRDITNKYTSLDDVVWPSKP
tara:strand:+ start:502 stop:825 length:324 start_codon:yes stop_codon:yes gene_type:complete